MNRLGVEGAEPVSISRGPRYGQVFYHRRWQAMSTSVETALTDAWYTHTISCTEYRILLTMVRAGASAFTYDQLVEQTGFTRRTLARVMEQLVTRGYLLVEHGRRGVPSTWTLQSDTARWEQAAVEDQVIHRSPVAADPVIRRSSDPPITPPDRSPKPRTPIQAPAATRRVLTSSSCVSSDFDPDQRFHDPHKEEAARELVRQLKLTHRQARLAIRANPNGVDIPAWLDWLTMVSDPEPMRILVARLKAGEPVPVIRAAPPPPAKLTMRQPTPAELAELRRQYGVAQR